MVRLLLLAACQAPRALAPLPPAASPAPSPHVAPAPVAVELARARVIATGDVMMHGSVKASAARYADAHGHDGFDALWSALEPALSASDLAFANMEFPVSPTTGSAPREMVFDAPPAALDSLAQVGFDILSFANNHVYDQGREGFVETLGELSKRPITTIGAGTTCAEARKARLTDVNGIRIAWIGSTALYNVDLNRRDDEPCAATFDLAWILDEVARARGSGADAVIVSVHWGVEYAPGPTAEQIAWGHALIDGGVDVILGHHPHVLQPIELVEAADGRIGLIAYSLGNLISSQSAWYRHGVHRAVDGDPRDGALLSFHFVRKAYRDKTQAIQLSDVAITPLFTWNNSHDRQGTPLDLRVAPVADWMAWRCAPQADEAAARRARRDQEMLLDRWARVRDVVGPGLVGSAPPSCAQ